MPGHGERAFASPLARRIAAGHGLDLAGIPGISLPCGFDRAGLPIGLQLLGPAFDEGMALIMEGNVEAALEAFGKLPEWFSEVVFVGNKGQGDC